MYVFVYVLCDVSTCDSWSRLFLCFKQDTAYDMRISDWSSDVCSSDLSTIRHRMCMGPCAIMVGELTPKRSLRRMFSPACEARHSLTGWHCPWRLPPVEIGRAHV